MSEMSNKLIDRLKKLLALAKDTRGNENEAAAAMEKVQALLAEYNLTMADLESQGGKDESGRRSQDKYEKSAMYEYQRGLMKAVAEAHYCLYWTGARIDYRGKRPVKRFYHVLVGREANVISARLMFEYLNTTIEKLSTERYTSRGNLSRSAISWKEGCASRLEERLTERREKADREQEEKVKEAQRQAREAQARASHPASAPQDQPSAGALVLLTQVRQDERDLNNDFLRGYEPGTTALRRLQNQARWEEEERQAVEKRRREAAELEARIAGMTDKERERYYAKLRKEEEAEEERSRKYWERWEKQQDAKWAKKDIGAYNAGYSKGNDIGLDAQVAEDKRRLQ